MILSLDLLKPRKRYNVTYRNTLTGKSMTYNLHPIFTLVAAEHCRDNFNKRYPGKPYPNGAGYYPYTEAVIEEVSPHDYHTKAVPA